MTSSVLKYHKSHTAVIRIILVDHEEGELRNTIEGIPNLGRGRVFIGMRVSVDGQSVGSTEQGFVHLVHAPRIHCRAAFELYGDAATTCPSWWSMRVKCSWAP